MTPQRLLLASTSRYRAELLRRLCIPFETKAPGVDETAQPAEAPAALASRLALAKAQAVAQQNPDALVIGSDQVADLNGTALGKPGSHTAAVAQLAAMSGQVVWFHTAVAMVWQAKGCVHSAMSPVRVQFRRLQASDIETYLQLDKPYDCAGSAKSESLGITLLESVQSEDPTSLIGLPLSTVCQLMRACGVDPLAWSAASRSAVSQGASC